MGCVRGESRICDSGGGDVGCVRGERGYVIGVVSVWDV